MVKCVILGCGGSKGVPQLGCDCKICSSLSPHGNHKNNRTRVSIFVEHEGVNILVDTSSDLRIQGLRNDISSLDAVLYSHAHADHVNGVDDIKPLIVQKPNRCIDAYMSEKDHKEMLQRYPYVFNGGDIYRPYMNAKIFPKSGGFEINGAKVIQYQQFHGNCISYGFRFGNLAYSTDFKELPDESLEALQNLDTIIIDCLRYTEAPSHCHLDLTLEWIEKINPKRAILTHMAHEICYEEIQKYLPSKVIPAYDGMLVEC